MFNFIHCLVNYGVLPLGVSSLTAWSTISVLMSPGYGGYQTATPPPYFTTITYATTGYYHQDSRVLHQIYHAPSYYTED